MPIELAHDSSVDAQVAANELRRSYWSFRTHRADLLPEIASVLICPTSVVATALSGSDGSPEVCVRTNSLMLKGELSVEQNIWLTGGKIRLSSSLQYLNPLNMTGQKEYFMSVPIGLTLEQPVFGTNHIKWRLERIRPVRYKEAQSTISLQCRADHPQNYLALLLAIMAQENLKIAEQNQENATRIYGDCQSSQRNGANLGK